MTNEFWVMLLMACAAVLGWFVVGELLRRKHRYSAGNDGGGGVGGDWFDGHGHSGDHGGGSDGGGGGDGGD